MSEWKWTVYRTTNLVNGNTYIGSHKTENPNDNYKGSGVRITRALKFHGKENFEKEVLHIFDNMREMAIKERELVGIEKELRGEDCYNLLCEYEGHWTHSEESRLKIKKAMDGEFNALRGKQCSDTHKENLSKALKGRKLPEETRNKMSMSRRGTKLGPMPEETKRKISEANMGKKNSESTRKKISEGLNKSKAFEIAMAARRGIPLREETKLKMSKSSKGIKRGPMSEESKRKMSKAKMGKKRGPMPEETKRKLSETHKRNHAEKKIKKDDKTA